jgi:hypothetical protein
MVYIWRGKRAITETFITVPLMLIGNGMLILYGRLLFRAESLEQIGRFTLVLATGAEGLDYGAAMPRLSAVGGILLLAVWEITQSRSGGYARFYHKLPVPLVALAVVCVIFLTFEQPASAMCV